MLKPANCDAVIVTVSLPPLPVSVSTPETVPSEKSTVVPLVVSTIWSRVPLPLSAPPWIDSPATNWPLAMLIVSSPAARRSIVSAPGAAGDGVGLVAAGDGEGFGLAAQRDGHAGRGAGGRDRLDALDRVVGRAQRVEVGRGRGQVDRVAGAGAEIDRARANEDGVELGAGERHRVGAGGAGEIAGLDVA